MCELKTVQMKTECRLIFEFTLHEFKLGHNTMEVTKNICYVKVEGTTDDPSTQTKWFKKFCLRCKKLDDQARQDQVDLKSWILRLCFKPQKQIWWAALGEYQASLVSLQSSLVSHLHDLSKSIWSASCYQNIAKLLTHLRIRNILKYGWLVGFTAS